MESYAIQGDAPGEWWIATDDQKAALRAAVVAIEWGSERYTLNGVTYVVTITRKGTFIGQAKQRRAVALPAHAGAAPPPPKGGPPGGARTAI